MKRFFFSIGLLVALLAACSPNVSGAECKQGICISIKVEEPVQASVAVPFTVSVKSDKDISGLGISILGDARVHILDVDTGLAGAVVAFQDERTIAWRMNTKGGQEYVIAGHVVFPKSTVSYGIVSYGLIATASQPSVARVTDSVSIYFDASGKQVDESEAKTALQTIIPVPTPPPDETIVPETRIPTVVWPSATPSLPLPTASQLAYPGPGKLVGTPAENKEQPTPTPIAYPNP